MPKRTKRTTKEFINLAKKFHGNKYDYQNTVYKNKRIKVKIICHTHGEFEQFPSHHLEGRGCRQCAFQSRRNSTESFISKAKSIHGDKYDYSQVSYINARKKITIICPVHGKFIQKPAKHLSGSGCNDCGYVISSFKITKTTEEFIQDAKKIHGDKYDYSQINYINGRTKVKIICKIHGIFLQVPNDHLISKAQCPSCKWKNMSEVGVILKNTFINWKIIPNKKIWNTFLDYNSRRFCDFWLEKDNINVMVEYDGQQHFRPVRFGGMSLKKAKKQLVRQKLIDNLDEKFCKHNGIMLHRIKYDQDKKKSIKELEVKLMWKYFLL